MKRPLTRVVLAVCIPVGLLLSACGFGGFTHSNTTDVPAPADAAGATDSPAATETSPPPQLIATDRTGVTAVQKLVNKADTVVVASKTNSGAGAQKAKELQAPLLIDDGTNTDAIATEIKRLKAKEERVADADSGASTAPSTPSTSAAPSAPSTSGAPTSAQTTAAAAGPTVAQLLDGYTPGGDTTIALVTDTTDAPSVLAAMAGGLTVERLAAADPRASVSLMAKKPATYYALGADFGTEADFTARLELADAGPVPSGKTGLVFPGRRIIALYGHPSGPALGVMGEQPPQEAVKRVNDLVRQYQELTPDTPTVPAFEVIATVASSSPGDDGDYSNEGTVEELRPYVEAIGKAGGFAVLDLQPGRASFLSQAQRYQELLALPYVGLALDPEWKIGPDEKPLGRVGNTTAAEVNEVSAWLADFTKTKKLPQKIFIMHQFQLQMIRNREQLNLNHPELSFVLHADGHGDAHDKMATWDKMREGLQPQIFMAWKNFIDEDTPMFDPRQTLGVQPTPWFISYQ